VVACTNAFASKLFPGIDVVPARGQVLLTAPIKGLKLEGCFHYDHGYYYFRNLGNRVLLGGARNKAIEQERTTEFNITGIIQEELERFLSTVILPGQSYEITDRWSGIMAMGSEKMPILKNYSDKILVAVRMSGMGVALAPVIGESVAAMID
jgi:glycine/D-amino acid oxidase-like deaminating enzyme